MGAYRANDDHSLDRGIGNAIYDSQSLASGSPHGLQVSTVRDEQVPALDGVSENVVLFSRAGVPENKLRATQEFVFRGQSATTYLYDANEQIIDKSSTEG